MAIEVGFYQDFDEKFTPEIAFAEGPFVMTSVPGGQWRVEVEYKGHRCPALPDMTIYQLLRSFPTRSSSREDIAKTVDWLNQAVKLGIIVQDRNTWVCPQGTLS